VLIIESVVKSTCVLCDASAITSYFPWKTLLSDIVTGTQARIIKYKILKHKILNNDPVPLS